MRPDDLPLLRSAGRPVVLDDGRVLVATTYPDLDKDLNHSHLVIVDADGNEREFTAGPRDAAPVLSPDGRTVVFARAGESGPAQLYAIRVDGGEARKLTDHTLGASAPVFSADGRWLAYLAPIPEPGRYGTDESIGSDAEAPRRITSMSYRRDGSGFLLDKPEQLFVLELGSVAQRPRQLTNEPRGAARAAFLTDGRIVYARATGEDTITKELVVIDPGLGGVDTGSSSSAAGAGADGSPSATASLDDHGADDHAGVAGSQDEPGGSDRATTAPPAVVEPSVLLTDLGGIGDPIVDRRPDGDLLYVVASTFEGVDFPGRTNGLFAVSLDGTARRLTDEATVDLDAQDPLPVGDRVLVAVLDRGATAVRAVPRDGDALPLDRLPTVIGGSVVVRGFDVHDGTLAAVVGDPRSTAELVLAPYDPADPAGSVPAARTVTDWGAGLRAQGIGETIELSGAGSDGYPVHGWLVLPPSSAPRSAGRLPVLLNVHGGPHSNYGWALFDEAQVYARAGYAVVLGNPRGSAGYGQDHGRAVVKAMGSVDVADVLALLDVALQRDDLDPGRVGVMGGSYGGFMTSWLASHAPERFVAGISERAVNAWDSFAGASDIGHFFAEGYVGADRDTQWRHSPLAYADKIDIPLLIMHSEHDWRCPVEQAQRLFVALKLRGAPTEMLLFPAEGHELSRSGRPRHRKQRFEAILQWWQRYLPVAASATGGASGASAVEKAGAPPAAG